MQTRSLERRRFPLAARLLALAAVVVALVFATLRLRARHEAIPASGGRELHVLLTDKEPHFLQRDPRWASARLGDTTETLGRVGCLVCALAVASDGLGAPLDPAELNRRLGASEGYTRDARVVWDKVSKATDGAVRVAVHPKPEHTVLDEALDRGQVPVVRFTLPNGAPHWVAIVGKEGTEYLVKDSLLDEPIVKLSSRTASIEAVRVVRRR